MLYVADNKIRYFIALLSIKGTQIHESRRFPNPMDFPLIEKRDYGLFLVFGEKVLSYATNVHPKRETKNMC
jgi:hypothetical protein